MLQEFFIVVMLFGNIASFSEINYSGVIPFS